MKRYKKVLLLAGCLLSTLLLVCIERHMVGSLATQQLAKRWSQEEEFAQLACYFTRDAGFTVEQMTAVQRSLITSLEGASVNGTKENGGRNWLDAYSTQGELSITSSRSSVHVRAFGVGGDFFQFHPLELLDGNYFDASDDNGDGVIIDEVVAWQLFGSNDVAGMMIEINGATYPVRGVVRSDKGMFSEAVDEEAATVYVSYGILEHVYGDVLTIDSYELLIANPVKGFAKDALVNALGMSEESYEFCECSARYGLVNRINVIRNFGVRSMNTRYIVFPYWENRAKGYEDVSALFLVLEIVCMGYPIVWALCQGHKLWKKRKTMKQGFIEKCKEVWKFSITLLKKTTKTYKLVDKE